MDSYISQTTEPTPVTVETDAVKSNMSSYFIKLILRSIILILSLWSSQAPADLQRLLTRGVTSAE